MHTSAKDALGHVKLLVLINDVSLRNLQAREFALGFGMLHANPSTHFGPYAVTPDELSGAWIEGRIDLRVESYINDVMFGRPRSGTGMRYGFDELIQHASFNRRLGAGTIIGSGTVSNRQDLQCARVEQGGVGFSCLSEARATEVILFGEPRTKFLSFDDRVRVEAFDDREASAFGAIDHKVRAYQAL